MDMKSLMPFGRSSSPARSGGEDDPFALMRREMDRMFESFSRDWGMPAAAGGFASPPAATGGFASLKVDVAESDKGLEISAELPGIDQKDIQLDLADGILTIKAEHQAEKEEKDEKKHYHLIERSRGSYLRRFAIPFEPEADKIQASFDKGVLHITVPRSKAAEKKVKKIKINGG
jgi:HSP20 family protein